MSFLQSIGRMRIERRTVLTARVSCQPFGATLSPPVAGASSSFAGVSEVAAGAVSAGAGVSAGAVDAAGAASAGAALSFFAHAVMTIEVKSTATAVVMVFISSLPM